MSSTESRPRIAVFIDFDNIEIGVRTTLNTQFDVGVVLDAIKERGEVVTKVAYSDWKRAGDQSRQLTQHAIRMVQRNMTPGGDKNGADITMALDALEMAFTHDHINTFVIVGGDSDFMPLVEKLKQYDRKVLVCGGRQFTSVILQQNCHEFIAYENLIGHRGGRSGDRGSRAAAGRDGAGAANLSQVLPLVQRALKVLSEREVSPQLGLLKSTLLQLDSTFSERDYGASSFRDFIEKVAQAGVVTLKHAGRNMLVEPVEGAEEGVVPPAPAAEPPRAPEHGPGGVHAHHAPDADEAQPGTDPHAGQSQAPIADASQNAEGIRQVQATLQRSAPQRWPMYVRQMRQHLRSAIEQFDERRYGFASVVDLFRACAREGIFRLERDRQGAVRLFPGPKLLKPAFDVAEPVAEPAEPRSAASAVGAARDVIEAGAVEVSESPVIEAITAEPGNEAVEPAAKRGRGGRGGRSGQAGRARKAVAAKPAGATGAVAKPAAPPAAKPAGAPAPKKTAARKTSGRKKKTAE